MRCKSCESANQRKFTSEIAVHVSGLKKIDEPVVWLFPDLVVCIDCGVALFKVPEDELRVLAEADSTAG
jgi:hypothetical protein